MGSDPNIRTFDRTEDQSLCDRMDKRNFFRYLIFVCLLFVCTGCCPHLQKTTSPLTYLPSASEREKLSPYPEDIAPIDTASRWGEEYYLGTSFAQEGDWYRALTSFRRSRFLYIAQSQKKTEHVPNMIDIGSNACSEKEILARLAWAECLIYGLSGKWNEVISTWERYRDHIRISSEKLQEQWCILLYAAYFSSSREDQAEPLLAYIPKTSPIPHALHEWKKLSSFDPNNDPIEKGTPQDLVLGQKLKSPTTARVMNALLPGSGYLYVGQKETACTSFLLNGAFIGATWQLLKAHQPFLAIITLSFETGWYLGGITGAGLEAEQFNLQVKETLLTQYLRDKKEFPLLLIRVGW